MLHSIAYAPREALAGDYLNAISRAAFATAHDISSYSFAALAKGARPLLQGRPASLLTLTYLGAQRALPNYNLMGLAKASLEANVRYLAACLGPEGIRVNGISAGPIKTLAAAGIGGFSKIFGFVERNAPLRRNVTIDEVGNVAAFYFSEPGQRHHRRNHLCRRGLFEGFGGGGDRRRLMPRRAVVGRC